ncbi:hypothetical protein ES708_03683 [subsurface metagenome]
MISGSRAGGMRKGDGRNLSGWIKRRTPALFAAPLTGGIDQPVGLAVLVPGFVAAVIQNPERKEKEVLNKKK